MSSAHLPPYIEKAHASEAEATEVVGRDAIESRARRGLVEWLGTRPSTPDATGHACGAVGVQARQTHYSAGFGLFLPTAMGTAVTVRRAETQRIAFAPHGRVWTTSDDSVPEWVQIARRTLQVVCDDATLEASVASSVRPACRDGYWASLVVALLRAVQALGVPTVVETEQVDVLRDALVPRLNRVIEQATGLPHSAAYLLATFAGMDPAFTLVDTETREYLPVRTDARSALRWALVDPGGDGDSDESGAVTASFHRRRKDQAEAALARLRREGFADLTAFRNLQHRDLDRATRAVPSALRPVVRHLVTENRRVQKHVAALRRSDWQMVGALLLMSHASLRDDWRGATPAANTLVEAVETRTQNGLYGACMTERGGGVLVVGRPRAFTERMHDLTAAVASIHGGRPTVLAL
ncbi:MAG: hypothetical protein ACLFTE_01035 [Salinivenus sp.]